MTLRVLLVALPVVAAVATPCSAQYRSWPGTLPGAPGLAAPVPSVPPRAAPPQPGATATMSQPARPLDPRTGLPLSTPVTLDPRTRLPQWTDPRTGLPTDPRTGTAYDPLTGHPVAPAADGRGERASAVPARSAGPEPPLPIASSPPAPPTDTTTQDAARSPLDGTRSSPDTRPPLDATRSPVDAARSPLSPQRR